MRSAVRLAVLALGAVLAPPAKAVDIDELANYLAYIESFQYHFEFCQAETKLPEDQVTFAWKHIAERRRLIFSGLDEAQRERVMEEMPAKRKIMITEVLAGMRKDQPDAKLKDLCKEGFFEGIIKSENKSRAKEVAAIRKAKKQPRTSRRKS
jgi:hypothetical protein